MSLNKLGQEFCEHAGVGKCNALPHVERAFEELLEAHGEAILIDHCDDYTALPELAKEFADVVLTIAAAAHDLGLDLDAAIARKHARNMAAKWIPHPDKPGLVKRVKP